MTEAFIEEDGYAVYCCAIVHEAARGKDYIAQNSQAEYPAYKQRKTEKNFSFIRYVVDDRRPDFEFSN